MTETLAYGYSSEITQQELTIEYFHDRVYMFFKHLWVLDPLDESGLSIGRVKLLHVPNNLMLCRKDKHSHFSKALSKY